MCDFLRRDNLDLHRVADMTGIPSGPVRERAIRHGKQRRVERIDSPDGAEWRQVERFPDFWVSNHNQVFNMKTGRLHALYRNNYGTLCIRIYRHSHHYNLTVDKMRREAFGIPALPTATFYLIPHGEDFTNLSFMCKECGDKLDDHEVEFHAEVAHKCKDVRLLPSGAEIS